MPWICHLGSRKLGLPASSIPLSSLPEVRALRATRQPGKRLHFLGTGRDAPHRVRHRLRRLTPCSLYVRLVLRAIGAPLIPPRGVPVTDDTLLFCECSQHFHLALVNPRWYRLTVSTSASGQKRKHLPFAAALDRDHRQNYMFSVVLKFHGRGQLPARPTSIALAARRKSSRSTLHQSLAFLAYRIRRGEGI